MGVGSIGPVLRGYEESNTFFSTDAGVSWTMVLPEAHKYEFGDKGGIIVAINDEETVDFVSYSTDLGETWYAYIPIPLSAFDRPCDWLIHLNFNVQETIEPRDEHPCTRAFDGPGFDFPEVPSARPGLAAGLNLRRTLRIPLPRFCAHGQT